MSSAIGPNFEIEKVNIYIDIRYLKIRGGKM